MVVFRQAMRGKHDRSCSSSSLAACLSGEDSFKPFNLDPHRPKSHPDPCATEV